MKTIKLTAIPFAFLVAATMFGGCIGGEMDEEAGDWTSELDEEAGEWTPELDEKAGEEATQEQPGLAARYNGRCGSGYRVIDWCSLPSGTVYLTYNRSAGRNCTITIRNRPGARRSMSAVVSLADRPWIADRGNYTTYAGPVYVYARNRCVDWGGSIGSESCYQYNEHCGP